MARRISRQARPHDELLFEAGAGPGRGAVQVAGARGAAEAERDEGARRGRFAELLRGWHDRIRRADGDYAGGARALPLGDRQPGHRIGNGCASRGRRGAGRAVGGLRRGVGRHIEDHAVHVRFGRQPDDACHDAGRVCRGHGVQTKTARKLPRSRWAESRRITKSTTRACSAKAAARG